MMPLRMKAFSESSAASAAALAAALRATGRAAHPRCFACGEPADGGLGLRFAVEADGGVVARWECPAGGEGYPGILHGGLTATLLDAAMTQALFARGIVARTGELTVRYRQPVVLGGAATVRARLRRSLGPLFELEAEVRQGASLCATARAKFMRAPGEPAASAAGGAGQAGAGSFSKP